MGGKLSLILVLVWIPLAIGQLLNWLYWTQTKEYRFDRLWIFFKTEDGKKKLGISIFLFKLAIIFLAFTSDIFLNALFIILWIFGISLANAIIIKEFRRPVFTKRAILILSLGLFLILFSLVIGFLKGSAQTTILLGEISIVISLLGGVLVTSRLVRKAKETSAKEAQEIINKVKPTVIGITGSYGKSTTKEFVAQFLSQKFPTVKTLGSENTELGVFNRVIKDIRKGIKFFTVELGAYKKGEIAAIAGVINPNIAIITGIEPQHFALFGSLEKLKEAKNELIDSLPPNGIALFNYTNEHCRLMAKSAKMKKLLVFGYGKKDADLTYYILKKDINGITFEIRYKKEHKVLFAPVKGEHFLENLSAAILLSRLLGLDWKTIEHVCLKIKLPEKTMDVFQSLGGIYVIDDSHNATPKSFDAAIDYLRLFKDRKKIIVTAGIIELGTLSSPIHEEIGKKVDKFIDKIILITKDFEYDISKGLKTNKDKLKVVVKPTSLINTLHKLLNSNTVVLFEGRMPSRIDEYIRELKNV